MFQHIGPVLQVIAHGFFIIGPGAGAVPSDGVGRQFGHIEGIYHFFIQWMAGAEIIAENPHFETDGGIADIVLQVFLQGFDEGHRIHAGCKESKAISCLVANEGGREIMAEALCHFPDQFISTFRAMLHIVKLEIGEIHEHWNAAAIEPPCHVHIMYGSGPFKETFR